MPDTRETLIEEVYRCMHCAHLRLPFVACDDAGRAFRFPPTIGAMGTAPLLFVGINPRVSDSNRHLHDTLMHDYPTFLELARNRFRGQPYIGPQGLEGHYSAHVRIARQLFPDQPFEAIAAVTELFFCASESGSGLPVQWSPCATKYFERVLTSIQPRVVFAMGRQVESYLIHHLWCEDGKTFVTWGQNARALMIAIPHPNARGEKLSKWHAAAETARAYLLSDTSSRALSGQSSGLTHAASQRPPAPAPTSLRLPGVGEAVWPSKEAQQRKEPAEAPQRHVIEERRKTIPSYSATRLLFDANVIEPLAMHEVFEVMTSDAAWRMTKADFYRVFPNVVASKSYMKTRCYHYPKPPEKAEQFRVR
jgi:hypothetical protein